MDPRLIALIEKRARLVAQAEYQRTELARRLSPLERYCGSLDQAAQVGRYLVARPYLIALATFAIMLLKPGRVWHWARRGWTAWQWLQKLQFLFRAR